MSPEAVEVKLALDAFWMAYLKNYGPLDCRYFPTVEVGVDFIEAMAELYRSEKLMSGNYITVIVPSTIGHIQLIEKRN